MAYEAKGKIVWIGDREVVSEKFTKREMALEQVNVWEGDVRYNYIKFQFAQKKCDVLDSWTVGDFVEVKFNIKGNRVEKDGKINYYTNNDAWQVKRPQRDGEVAPPAGGAPQTPQPFVHHDIQVNGGQGTATFPQPAKPAPGMLGEFEDPNNPEPVDDLPF